MRAFLALAVAFLVLSARADDAPGRKRRTLPQDFGRVVMDNHSAKAKLPPAVFDHWFHRAKYTCRVCHVDIGFAMKANATDLRAVDNAKGMFCGACHNERARADGGGRIFGSCTTGANRGPTCARCHQPPAGASPASEFASFTRDLPKGRFGNGIDWEQAESKGLIKPADFVEGVSIRRASISAQKDFSLSAKLPGMPDIIFSHAKHTVWSGCEGCHPDIFVGVKKGATKYTMADIFQGKSCGVCHVTVAFPTIDCQRCHSTRCAEMRPFTEPSWLARAARVALVAVVLAPVLPEPRWREGALAFGAAFAEEGWAAEFEAVCAQTQDAMTLSTDELRALVRRCDALKPRIDALDEFLRKVYARRLQGCRQLYAFMLESRNAE